MKTPADHYHDITRITARWRAFREAVDQVATDTVAERERRARLQHSEEVHVRAERGLPREGS